MSYLVLARKHRPPDFAAVVGQEHVTRTLAGALASDRLAHAFCFTGPRGVGKTSVARILAKALNCQEGPTTEPCGKCHLCQEIDQGRALDVQEIDAASNSSVEDVRELREVIRYRPQAARFRVTILDEVHMLSKAAFNALLKTLEEPPEHAVFILATTDVHKVPLTILSRCQRYDFRRVPPRILAGHLAAVLKAEGRSLPAESIALISREADGSVRDALSLLDQLLSLGRDDLSHAEVVELLGLIDTEMVRQSAQAVLAGDGGRLLDLVEQVYAAGGEMQAFYGALQEHFRNLAAAQAAGEGLDLFGLSAEEIAELRRQAQGVSPETLHEIFQELAASEELFRRASQPRLVMEMTLLKLTQVRPVLHLDEIVERLAAQAPPAPAPAPPPKAGPAQKAAAKPRPPVPPAPEEEGLPDNPDKALGQLADYVSRAEPTLALQLAKARLQRSQRHLAITLPGGVMARAACTPQKEETLARLAAELWGGAFTVSLSCQAPPAEERKAPTDSGTQNGRTAVASHPAVAEAVEVFEAEVVAIKPSKE